MTTVTRTPAQHNFVSVHVTDRFWYYITKHFAGNRKHKSDWNFLASLPSHLCFVFPLFFFSYFIMCCICCQEMVLKRQAIISHLSNAPASNVLACQKSKTFKSSCNLSHKIRDLVSCGSVHRSYDNHFKLSTTPIPGSCSTQALHQQIISAGLQAGSLSSCWM